MKKFKYSESRAKGSMLASDRPGHSQSKGTGHGAMGNPADPKDFEADRFAGELAAELNSGRTDYVYRRLVLVAGPHFHGLLTSHLDKHTRAMVGNHIHKDLINCTGRELPARLKNSIPIHDLPL